MRDVALFGVLDKHESRKVSSQLPSLWAYYSNPQQIGDLLSIWKSVFQEVLRNDIGVRDTPALTLPGQLLIRHRGGISVQCDGCYYSLIINLSRWSEEWLFKDTHLNLTSNICYIHGLIVQWTNPIVGMRVGCEQNCKSSGVKDS